MTPYLTYAIIFVTVVTSIKAFNDTGLKNRMLFNPYLINHDKDYIRLISSGFIHADYMHLFVNMYVLYAFGQWVELFFTNVFPVFGGLLYVLLYMLGIAASQSISYFKHRTEPHYNSLGASGAVSAVLFAAILLFPMEKIYFVFLPFIGIPAFIFGLLYLLYCQFMARRGGDHINHDAHFAGAVFGVVFTALMKPTLLLNFIEQITL